ncbi:hypothetical protein O9929_22070 [Vibrio lentus]|nr:hypothetical protein [Vibrio lentus]
MKRLKPLSNWLKDGFVVLPYCHADPVLCSAWKGGLCCGYAVKVRRLVQIKGIASAADFCLEIIIDQANVPVIVDAGIGAPSRCSCMEMGSGPLC